jgi:hypothetical protein
MNNATFGGGIYNQGSLVSISDSTINGNGAAYGGGIYNKIGVMTLDSSTVDTNPATARGGGINTFAAGTLNAANSTISGNTAATEGGGISIESNGKLSMMNSTVCNNSAPTGAGIWNYRWNIAAGAVVGNSIVANSIEGENCSGSISSSGHNLSSDNTCGFADTGDLNNTNPDLGPLAQNGGPTRTHALLSSSPAIDSGDNAGCPDTDQRGVDRPQDGNGDSTFICDRGAFELLANNKPTLGSLTPSTATSRAGAGKTFTAVYKDADGYDDLKTVDFLVSPTGSGANAIWARYNRATNKLMLYNDTGTALLRGRCTPGVAGTLQNGQGKIICGATTVTTSGNNLTVKWRIVPKISFSSPTAKKLKMKAVDNSNATSGWKVKGSWTINP